MNATSVSSSVVVVFTLLMLSVELSPTYVLYTISEYAFSLQVVLKFSFQKNYPGVNKIEYIKFTLFS